MEGGFTNSSPPHRVSPKEHVDLSLMRCYMGDLLFVNDLFLDPEAQALQPYATAIGQFQ